VDAPESVSAGRAPPPIGPSPYASRAAETRVQKGTLYLDLDSTLRKRHLRAPGRVVISDLEFAPARGVWDTFMGLPRGAVVNSLKSKDLDNPHFALNEAFATRVAVATAERLGVSIQGVALAVSRGDETPMPQNREPASWG
jgi:hypothetical protein